MSAEEVRHSPEVEDERASGEARTASALFIEMGWSARPDRRQLKWAWAWTIGVHFLLFAVVVPTRGTADFAFDEQRTTVIKRYKPPEIERPKTIRKRRKAQAVPIPDPTPDAFEPLITDEELLAMAPVDAVDLDWQYGPPTSIGPPFQAVAIETEGLVLPALLEQVEPDYDAERARRGVQGAADVEIVINTEGAVSEARIVNSSTDDTLDQAALVAVRKWLFEPGSLDGELVPVRAIVTINFRVY
ncbi:MAG: TonB family protein [Acidobacteria bacterium]|nr:TonB family protein [Acidobacteriota bacterium]